jgi:predicted nuclease with TOPRIM domain
MSPVFLSYKRVDDAARAKVVRDRLEALGLEIFQDVDMSAGTDFHTDLNKRIRAATAVLVLWSRSSIDSRWVLAEAKKGLELDKLVAVGFDRDITKEVPMPFNGIQTPDLSDWIENGSKADHHGWRSVLKALGGLSNRPLVEIANIREAGTPEAKADFVRDHPNDPFAASFAAELKAATLYEFEQEANRHKQLAERQLANEIRRMNQLRSQLAGMTDAAVAAGNYPKFDVKQEIHKVLNRYDADQSPDAPLGKRGRKALLEEIARMSSEIGDLRNAAAAAESAKAESDDQKLVIADLEKQVRQGSRPAAWLMAAAVILGVSAGFAIDRYNRQDSIPVSVADAERKKVQDQLNFATQQLSAANVENRRVSNEATETSRKLDAAEKTLTALTRENHELSDKFANMTASLDSARGAVSPLNQQLETANGTVTSLTKEKGELSGKLAETTANLVKAMAALDLLTKKHEATGSSLDTLTGERDGLSGRLGKTVAALDSLNKQYETASRSIDTLTKERDGLSGKLTETTASLVKATAAFDSLAKKHDAANGTVDTLTKEKDGLSGKLTETTASLVKATAALDSLTKKYEAVSKSIDTLTREKDGLSGKLTETTASLIKASAAFDSLAKKHDAANGAVDTLTKEKKQLQDQLTSSQYLDGARAANETQCDEFMAYDTDPDLPANARRPGDQTKLGGATPQDAVDTCFAALTALPKSVARRVLLQLARSYIRLGNGPRATDQPLATRAFSTAVMLARQAARLGSTQADVMLGYIYGGLMNTSKFTLIDTPNYPYAFARFEASAAAKHPFALLYAGSYLTWPGCSENMLSSDPEKGLRYIREAQEKNIAAAYYAEGYFWYFAPPGVKQTEWARKMFEKASTMNFKEADAFLGMTPPKPASCPMKFF